MTRIDVRETALLRTEKVRRRLLRHAAILGGVVAQVGDRVFDASLRARLEALRQALAGA